MNAVEKIFSAMKERHLTAKQVAADTGISQSNFTEWKKGRCFPKAESLSTLAKYFDIPFEYLVNDMDDDIDKYKIDMLNKPISITIEYKYNGDITSNIDEILTIITSEEEKTKLEEIASIISSLRTKPLGEVKKAKKMIELLSE